jgi:prepilin-type N-terminal cleavage/methylation domain-containing protein
MNVTKHGRSRHPSSPLSSGRKRFGPGRSPCARARGFTLLELLVVVLIAVGLIFFLSALYQTVGRTMVMLDNVENEWRAEQFIRRQYLLAHRASVDFDLFEAAGDTLSFVSYKSARHGEHGPPTLVRYRFAPEEARLVYQERSLPAWWQRSSSLNFSALLSEPDGWWEETALHQVGSVSFSYLAPGIDSDRWREIWDNRKALPQLVRVRIERARESRDVVLETGVLSFFTPSGF